MTTSVIKTLFFFLDIFLLGIESGILYPHKSLIGQSRMFHLVIEARDGAGSGHLSDKAEVFVQVLNVNEYKPTFIMPALSNATVELTEVSFFVFFHSWYIS